MWILQVIYAIDAMRDGKKYVNIKPEKLGSTYTDKEICVVASFADELLTGDGLHKWASDALRYCISEIRAATS